MEPVSLTKLFGGVAFWLVQEAVKSGWARLDYQPTVAKAIQKTEDDLAEELEGVATALTAWCRSEDFDKLAKAIAEGNRDVIDDAVVLSFVETSQFSCGNETDERAAELLRVFLRNIVEEIYTSSSALPAFAARHEATHREVKESIQALAAGMYARLDSLPGAHPQTVAEKTETEEGSELGTKIDAAAELVVKGQARSARILLEKIKEEIGEKPVNPHLRFRIAANLGACHLQLGDVEEAKKAFDQSLIHEPNAPRGLANRAQVALLEDDEGLARELAEKAFELDSKDSVVAAVYLMALHKSSDSSKVDSVLKAHAWIEQDPVCILTLAEIAVFRGRYDKAKSLAKKALAINEENAGAWDVLGTSVVLPIQNDYLNSPVLPWKIPHRSVQRLEEADQAYSRAAGILEKRDDRRHLHDVLSKRAAVRSMLGRYEPGLADCDRVLRENPNFRDALNHRGNILMIRGKFKEAAECFARSTDTDHPRRDLAEAYARLKAGQTAKAGELALAVWDRSAQHSESKLQAAEILLETGPSGADEKQTEEILSYLGQEKASDPHAAAVLAGHLRRQGNMADAVSLYAAAIAESSGAMQDLFRIELGNLHYANRDYASAVEAYEPVVDPKLNVEITHKYLVCLFNADLYHRCLSIARQLRTLVGAAIPLVTELECRILEHVGDLTRAAVLRAEMAEQEPKDYANLLSLAHIQYRLGKEPTARRTIDRIPFGEVAQNAKILMGVAQIRAWLDLPEALEYAYQARRVAPSLAGAHGLYVTLFLAREKQSDVNLRPTSVGLNTTVHLQTGNERISYTILTGNSTDATKGEISAEDTKAKLLLGLEVGDSVTLGPGLIQEHRYEVVEIQSKFVSAFQQTLEHFGEWFPEEPFDKVSIKDGGVEQVLSSVDQRHAYISNILDGYRSGSMTVGTMAELTGASMFDTWSFLTSSHDCDFRMALGTRDEMATEEATLSSARTVCMDVIALFTMCELELLDRLVEQFDKILVPQQTLDDIRQTALLDRQSQKGKALVREGYHYRMIEATESQRESRRSFLEAVELFITGSTQVVPAIGLLELERDRERDLTSILGRGALASALTAASERVPLYSDDERLRSLARTEWKIQGFNTQTVLKSLREQGHISDEIYHRSVVDLVAHNYHFVSVGPDETYFALRQENLKLTYKVRRIFTRLEGPGCNEDQAVHVVTEVLKKLWLDEKLSYSKTLVLDLALNSLLTGRRPNDVMRKFEACVKQQFELLPLQRDEILQSTRLFVNVRFRN